MEPREPELNPRSGDLNKRVSALEKTINKGDRRLKWFIGILIFTIMMSFGGAFFLAGRNAVHIEDLNQVIANLEQESSVRSDQVCIGFENTYRKEVEQLNQTYDYLIKLPVPERTQSFNPTIIALLPRQEAAVKRDRPPKFCDDKDIGLKGDNPTPPARPQELLKWLPYPPPPSSVRPQTISPEASQGHHP